MSFDKKLQSLRKTSGLSQEELAQELGVSRQAVSKWESGTSYPEMDKLILMTRLFKCSLDDLVNDEIKDSSIIQNKTSKGQTYIDSLLEFINKSITMFTSMKFSSVLKCLIELSACILIMVFISSLLYMIVDEIICGVFGYPYYDSMLGLIAKFFSDIILIVLIAINVIVFFQFYKIRYLDYFDKLVYQYEVKKDKVDETSTEVKKEEPKGKINVSEKKGERIIIRDPKHRPLAFLSTISRIVIIMFRILLVFVTLPFVFLLISLIIALVILLYLISYNTIFIGISLSCLAAIILTILIMYILNLDLFKKRIKASILALIFLGIIFVGSLGIGVSVISLKNIDIKDYNQNKSITKTIDFNDKLYLNVLSSSYHDFVTFVVDEAKSDIEVTVEYDSKYLDYEFDSPANDPEYLVLYQHFNDEINIKEEIDEFLKNIKNNVIYSSNNRMYYASIYIRTNEKNIKKLINNISEKEYIRVNVEKRKGFTYYEVKAIELDKQARLVCELDDYYRKCITLIDKTNDASFTFDYKNNELTFDSNKYSCYILTDYSYACRSNK